MILGTLLRRARLTPADMVASLRARKITEVDVDRVIRLALGDEPPTLGILRLWVAVCGGTDADEVAVWVAQGWTDVDARELVASLPPRTKVRAVRRAA